MLFHLSPVKIQLTIYIQIEYSVFLSGLIGGHTCVFSTVGCVGGCHSQCAAIRANSEERLTYVHAYDLFFLIT